MMGEVIWQLKGNFRYYDFFHPNAKYHAFINDRSVCKQYWQDTYFVGSGIEESELMRNPEIACQRCLKKVRDMRKGQREDGSS